MTAPTTARASATTAPASAKQPLRTPLRAYLACARMEFRTALTYRTSYLSSFAMMLLQIWLLTVVWKALYDGRAEVDGLSLTTMTAYATLTTLQYQLVSPWRSSPIDQRVREGKVAVDLLRPVGFPGQMLAGQLGWASAAVPVLLVALPFALLIGAGQAPASAAAGFAYPVSLIGALLVNQLLGLLLGMVCFWTLEVSGALMAYRFVAQFFSGALVPLWFMPGPVRVAAEWLPFQATAYTPAAVYLGQVEGPGIVAALGVQFAWIAALGALAALVWSRARRRVMSQGG
ncbi:MULTISPECIES: ABC-2 family transporter protein [Streptomyces]|uniref:ABC-2 family transporter protein n=1 Tax=Streptomyces durocortorensis TaxID=2811104 RepID=A0ABS2HYL1_9ACTN|nr:ABC-2 family transporter protein [Streptomyces durocortorensis]MBM7054989.1 ABC-2 family transporter protein [Streptomyces durocortorensis]